MYIFARRESDFKYCYSKAAHGGCGFTLNEIREAVYWIVGAIVGDNWCCKQGGLQLR